MGTQVWFVTGSASGLGRAVTLAALEAGHSVVATARNIHAIDDLQDRFDSQILRVAMDVTSPAEVQHSVAAALTRFGRIDVLVNNAGYGLFGAFEEIKDQEARRQFEVNVFGLFAVTRAILPAMRRQQSGLVMNVSSIGGRVAYPALSVYHATKFAVEGMSESLAQEVAPFGIKVTIIEPGSLRTDWSGRSAVTAAELSEYANTPAGYVRNLLKTSHGQEPGDPARAAQVIVAVAQHAEPPLRLPLGADAFAGIRTRFQTDLQSMQKLEAAATATSFSAETAPAD